MDDERLRRHQHEEFDQEWAANEDEQTEHLHRETPRWAQQPEERNHFPTREEQRVANGKLLLMKKRGG